MKQSQTSHLPVMGVGPIYVISIVIITIFAIIFGRSNTSLPTNIQAPNTPVATVLAILGAFIILLGLIIYVLAIKIKITKAIKENRLLTTGIYSVVRNPIYSAWLLLCTGFLLLTGSLLLALSLFLLFWLYLTILMKHTEEKWLAKLYGDPYLEYCKKVNRCLPWFPKKNLKKYFSKNQAQSMRIFHNFKNQVRSTLIFYNSPNLLQFSFFPAQITLIFHNFPNSVTSRLCYNKHNERATNSRTTSIE